MNENESFYESFWYHNYQVVQAQLVEYYERNQKAIEYIKERFDEEVLIHTFDKDNVKELLDILKGSDKE